MATNMYGHRVFNINQIFFTLLVLFVLKGQPNSLHLSRFDKYLMQANPVSFMFNLLTYLLT
jgi:hypothetical protein